MYEEVQNRKKVEKTGVRLSQTQEFIIEKHAMWSYGCNKIMGINIIREVMSKMNK